MRLYQILKSIIQKLNSIENAIGGGTDTGWINLNAYIAFRYKNGIVYVIGDSANAKALTANAYTSVVTIPAGYRPTKSIPFTFHRKGGIANGDTGYIVEDGNVNLYTKSAGSYWAFSVSYPL